MQQTQQKSGGPATVILPKYLILKVVGEVGLEPTKA